MSMLNLEELFKEKKERKPFEEKVVAKNVTIPRKLIERIQEKMKKEGIDSFSYILSKIIEKGLEDEKV